jgi:RNA recognition motif-containing protein
VSKKLYAGGLPYSVDENQLREIFAPYGEVLSANVIVDKISGRSKGFGFVEMAPEHANAAIEGLNGKEYEGRNLTVNEARPMAPRTGGDRSGGQRRDRGSQRW